jgi:hypothetical protein
MFAGFFTMDPRPVIQLRCIRKYIAIPSVPSIPLSIAGLGLIDQQWSV